MYGKGFLGNMTENLHADCVQSRQAGFMQCFLHMFMAAPHKTVRRTLCSVSFKHALVPGQTLILHSLRWNDNTVFDIPAVSCRVPFESIG